MRLLVTLAVVAPLMWPTGAAAITFGEWASAQGYYPGDVMPGTVEAEMSSIDSLAGIGEFDWTTTPTKFLHLDGNQLSSITSGDFTGLTNLTSLNLNGNQLSNIESGAFSGLENLVELYLDFSQLSSIESGAFSGLTNLAVLDLSLNTALTELNLGEADFSSLTMSWWTGFDVAGNWNITSVSLRNAVVNQTSLATLLKGGCWFHSNTGIGELGGIIEMDLSGIDFGDITDLAPLYLMDDLTDLWLVDTLNLDASDLDVMLDNLATIEGISTEGILHMTQANFDAFNIAGGGLLATWDSEDGHHVEFVAPVLPGDYNGNGAVEQADLDLVLLNWGTETPPNPEGWIGAPPDGLIEQNELDDVLLNWGSGIPGDDNAVAVPEPGAAWLLLLAMASLCLRRHVSH